MAKVVMTKYTSGVLNQLVFPECPYAGRDEGYTSLEVRCIKADMVYCSTLNEMKTCPFDLEKLSC